MGAVNCSAGGSVLALDLPSESRGAPARPAGCHLGCFSWSLVVCHHLPVHPVLLWFWSPEGKKFIHSIRGYFLSSSLGCQALI